MVLREKPAGERPRERCLSQGARSLSLRECLALVLNSGPREKGALGLASSLLEKPGSGLDESAQERAFFHALEISGAAHLENIAGLGPAGRARLLAAFEMGRRYAIFRESQQKRQGADRHPSRLARLAASRVSAELRNEPREWLGFVPLYPSGELGSLCIVERGVRTHVNVEPMELFARILALRPRGIVLFHNHPSGSLLASPADEDLTRRVAHLSRSFGLRLLAHGIVTANDEAWIPVGP